jgi:PAS domain S-box-containing protein
MPTDPPIRVLLVEDNPGDARLIRESLGGGSQRFELRTCDRLADLRPSLAAGPVDLILLDLGLPDCQGLETFLEAQNLAPGIPIVVLSGLSDQDIAIRAVREGAQDYLVKGSLDDDPLPRIVRHTIERRHADEALRRSEARFRAAVEAGPDAFFILEALRDAAGRICSFTLTDMNTRAEKLVGAPTSELVGRPVADWHPFEAGHQSIARFTQVVETRESIEEELTTERTADGLVTWTLRQIHPLGDGVAVVIRDITARKRMEEQLRQTQKMEAVGQLAAGVAHDFRNLVSAIQGHIAHAHRMLPKEHPAVECLNLISDAAKQAGGIAGSLLTFTRKTPVEKRAISLSTVIEQAVSLLRHTLPANITIQTRIAEPALFVSGDLSQLQQVIMNLAINARDAMPSGGILTIDAGPCGDDGATKPGPRGLARLTVRDTGIGMTPEVRARIFEPYFTTKPRGQGTGLGLPIIHGIISDLGGSIVVESRLGAGTTFTVVLPAVDPPPVAAPHPAPAEQHRTGALIADGNPFLREVMTSMLTSMNFDVIQAADAAGAERLAKSAGMNIELIIAAAQLPDAGGPECIRMVREAGQKSAKAILLTSGEAPSCAGLGVLTHPFRRADLAREIERLRSPAQPAPA